MKALIIYLAAVNLFTFALYGIDKLKAKRHAWRVPEATLLGLAAVGGSAGALLAMRTFHHKTHHLKFKYGVPTILSLQLLVAYFLILGRS